MFSALDAGDMMRKLHRKSPEEVGKEWLLNFRERGADMSDRIFSAVWRMWVPVAYYIEPNSNCLDITFDEESIQSRLIAPLDYFICGGEPVEKYKSLTALDSPPSFCGKVFKSNEPTYTCRDCFMDPTCVLCIDCFKASEHRYHRYKMSTSQGSGYCDCGDIEAWKSAPYCLRHIPGSTTGMTGSVETGQGSASIERLPADVAARARIMFNWVIKYALHLLTLEGTRSAMSMGLEVGEVDCEPLHDGDLFKTLSNYVTVIYNDESHTYDQVIHALSRALTCSRKDAREFATIVDRDGRCVLKCGNFKVCEDVEQEVRKLTSRNNAKALKVCVRPANVVAHQMFALKLLSWLNETIKICQGFRYLFAEIMMEQESVGCDTFLDQVLLSDVQLWKNARTSWHLLLISSFLMEVDLKRTFARRFISHYSAMMDDFIHRDDHEHSVCITSLSVQLFTVPTLAQSLIAEDEALSMLMRCFKAFYHRKLSTDGAHHLSLEHASSNPFRRAQFILSDLKHLLSVLPDASGWSTELKKAFVKGLKDFVEFLYWMQGMDEFTRQVGEHMEYERDWENGFNLHLRMAPVITLFTQWACSERSVLFKAVRAVVSALEKRNPASVWVYRSLQLTTWMRRNHRTRVMVYDVASQPVSFHLPLSRFLAALVLGLQKFNLDLNSDELNLRNNYELITEIMEPVLRLRVLTAQVHAAMWRRNGMSLMTQLYHYHSVKCRSEMMDRDLVLLQYSAAHLDQNDFLIHALNRFDLLDWAMEPTANVDIHPDEDYLRHLNIIADEFLSFLIELVGERWTVGIGQVEWEDCLKKEIIQYLCIKPLPHSSLIRLLDEDINHETGIEKVINDIATFTKKTGQNKGVYELKPEFYSQFNLFYYHYTREDQGKSEEAQRRRKFLPEDVRCCPPPPLPALTKEFSGLAKLVECDVFLQIAETVLKRAVMWDRPSLFTESQFRKLLFLIGLGLREEERREKEQASTSSVAGAGPKPGHYSTILKETNIVSMLKQLDGSPKVETHQGLLTWVLRLVDLSVSPASASSLAMAGSASSSAVSASSPEQDKLRERKQAAAARRAKIMAMMNQAQKSFVKVHEELYASVAGAAGGTDSDVPAPKRRSPDLPPSRPAPVEEEGPKPMDTSDDEDVNPVAVGPGRTPMTVEQEERHTCILCQESHEVRPTGKGEDLFLYVAYIQRSSVLRRDRQVQEVMQPTSPVNEPVLEAVASFPSGDDVTPVPSPPRGAMMDTTPGSGDADDTKQAPTAYMTSNLGNGIHTSSCGHTIHTSCYQAHYEVVCHRLRNRNIRYRQPPLYDITENEFLCPLCQRPCNAVLPVLPASCALWAASPAARDFVGRQSEHAAETSSSPLVFLQSILREAAQMEGDVSGEANTVIESMSGTQFVWPDFEMLMSSLSMISIISDTLRDMLLLFANRVFSVGFSCDPHDNDPRLFSAVTQTVSFSITATEQYRREIGKPLLGEFSSRQSSCLSGLVRFAALLAPPLVKRNRNKDGVSLVTLLTSPQSNLEDLLAVDPFSALVTLTLFSPTFANGDNRNYQALRVALWLHLFQVHVSRASRNPPTRQETQSRSQSLKIFFSLRDPDTQEAVRPFLHCCAIFYHFLTDIAPQPALTAFPSPHIHHILSYLSLGDLLDPNTSSSQWMDEISSFLGHWSDLFLNVSMSSSSAPHRPLIFPVTRNHLVPLPREFAELLNNMSNYTCPKATLDEARQPSVCLVCGEKLCSNPFCCQLQGEDDQYVGPCTRHAITCGLGVGIFLRVRDCKIILLHGKTQRMKGCFYSPPYVDGYGETDMGLKRGNPLHLCPEKYRELELIWFAHDIPEKIAQQAEVFPGNFATDWNQF
ncbi:unnamed protein product [Cyprideis torosa]|uniref:E3 ubiquitin-protein ligase n=1 Tax=Cyprideis torosa TaxID=163714 RepID=A0A7R8ZLE8_9CRUS|nr:unnamed protein product [Cyprideis torosa]CAG0883513.1 unnamed protein product [Cyprideis torosa]